MPPKKDTKKKRSERKLRISKWYKPDDEDIHVARKSRNTMPKRRNLTPGQILIILTGRFAGKRVVFLNFLKSGLLLVTGPFKINGVPLKRVNRAYVMQTSQRVDLNGVNFANIDDKLFIRPKAKKAKKSEKAFFATGPEVLLFIPFILFVVEN